MFERCLYFNTNALARVINQAWNFAYGEFDDLSVPHIYLIRLVLDKPGLLQYRIAKELELSPSTVTRFINALEKTGYLERKNNSDDGREHEIYPTPKARAIETELNRIGQELTAKMSTLFGNEIFQTTVDQLKEFRKKLK